MLCEFEAGDLLDSVKLPDQGQTMIDFPCEKSDDKSGQNSGDQKNRKISEQCRGFHKPDGYEQLSHVVGDSSDHTDGRNRKLSGSQTEKHEKQTAGCSRKTVNNRKQASEEEPDNQNPCKRYKKGLLQGKTLQNQQYGQIGESELDAGNTRKHRNQRFYVATDHGNGGKKTKK